MKCEIELNVSGLKSDVLFIKQCCAKNKIKNNPESAIATFLATDDFNKVESAIIVSCNLYVATKIDQNEIIYNVLAIIYNDFK